MSEDNNEKNERRLKMCYYPIKSNDSRPDPNPIFIMSAPKAGRSASVWTKVFMSPSQLFIENVDLKHDTMKSDPQKC